MERVEEREGGVTARRPAVDPARIRVAMVRCEMAGNLYVTMKNPAEAEKRYRAMLQKGSSLYQEDKKTYDLLFAQANLRMGVFYKGLIKRRAFLEHGTVSFLRLRRIFHGHIQIACHLAEYHLQADPGRFPFRKTCLTFFFDFFQTCQLLLRLVFFLQRSRNLLLQPFYRFF